MEIVRKLVQTLWVFLVNGFLGLPPDPQYLSRPAQGDLFAGPQLLFLSGGHHLLPTGSLQQLLLSIRFSLETGNYYLGTFVVGSMGILGAAFGRLICGWACPFGLFQELLHKIPSVKLPVPKILTWGKYGFLALFVVILPLVVVDEFGLGAPWFCNTSVRPGPWRPASPCSSSSRT